MNTITPLRLLPHWSWLPSLETIRRFSTIRPPERSTGAPSQSGWQFAGEIPMKEFISREVQRTPGVSEEAVRRRVSRGYYPGLKVRKTHYESYVSVK